MKSRKRIGLAALGLATLATAFLPAPSFAGRGAHRAELAGVIRNGGVDAIIAKLEKAENMPATAETIELVETLLSHDDYRAREAAAWWFARRPHHKDRLTADARGVLISGDSRELRDAADMLGTFRHPRVVSALAAAASRGGLETQAREAIVRALGTIGHPAANPAISAAMSDTDATVRLAAVTAWASILRQDGAAPVAALLADSDARVRRVAARVLGTFRQASARAELEAILDGDSDALSRRNAAFALGRIGDAASRSVLTSAAQNDASSLVRAYSSAALRTVGL